MPRVAGLFIYPVKSCRGHAVSSAAVDAWGFVADRRYMVVSPAGDFFTQRQFPRMALIETELTTAGIGLAAAGHPAIEVSLLPRQPTTLAAKIWKDAVLTDDCGDAVADWLTRFLGTPARLVHMGADYHRPVKAQPGDTVSFADGYPFLAITEASVAQLNDRIIAAGAEPVPSNRFRANLVLSGGEAFAEDAWARFRVGEVTFRNAGPCIRCSVTTTDQHTAERGKEPLRTLATFRRADADPTDVKFGANLINETKSGTVRVGDELLFL